MQLRSISNKKKPSQLTQTTQLLEKETKHMEEQLQQLKQIMQQEKFKRESEKPTGQNGTRWKAAKIDKGLRNYTQNLLQKKNSFEKKSIPTVVRPTSAKLQPLEKSIRTPAIDKDVEIFFTQVGLLQYKEKFQNYTIQSLKNVTVQQLREMGILPGHQIKIMRALKEMPENIQQMQEDSFCQSRVSVSVSGVQCNQAKLACWLCYKIFDDTEINCNGRNFCSQQCLIQFNQEYMIKCSKCNKKFYKNDGCVVYDNYYCSQSCSIDANDSVKGCSTNTIESVIEEDQFQQTNYAEQFNEFLTSSLLNN
ncbi:unnamed protein product [Paramecium octaurelia]|uniref:SAM domain-containing protein n=1 Tax=Paramecium octaurelia TaxID=43137 RepID=A0A8S1V355_PAROT|nr:unnamed protein product [Paramecium octaurelia]